MTSEALVGITFRVLGSMHELGTGLWRGDDSNLARSLAAATTPRWLPDLPGRVELLTKQHEAARDAIGTSAEIYYWRETAESLRDLFVRGGFSPAQRFGALRLATLTLPVEFMIPDLNLVSDALRPEPLTTLFALGLADSHVHSGAAVPFRDLVVQLLESPLARDRRESVMGLDHNGREFDVGTLAAGLRVGWWALWAQCEASALGHGVESPELRRMIRDGSFWRALRKAAVGRSGRDLGLAELLQVECSVARPGVRLETLSTALERALLEDAPWALHLSELLRALCLLRSATTAVPGEGLSRFVTRFDALRQIRRSGTGGSSLVHRAALGVTAGGQVQRFELRKTEYPDRGRFYDELRSTVGMHLRGTGEALIETGIDAAFQMPVGFHRQGLREARLARASGYPRFDMSAHFSLVEAWVELVHTNPAVAPYVMSFDVAGDEDAFPNWPFSVIFDEAACRVQGEYELSLSVHCGESFPTPLTGLRRVGDILLFERPVARIGHGLALSRAAARAQVPSTIAGLELCSIAEIVDDLAWVYAMFGPDVFTEAQRSVADRVVAVAYRNQGVGLDELAEAYRLRFTRAALLEVGLLSRHLESGDWTDVSPVRKPLGSAVASRRLLWNYVYGVTAGGICLDTDVLVPRDMIAELASAYDGLYEELVDRVVNLLVERKVVVETCPTSNAILGHLSNMTHPWSDFVSQGLKVTVNTDDPGVFHNHVLDEFEVLYHGVAHDNLKRLDESRIIGLETCASGVTVSPGSEYLDVANRLLS